MGRCYKTVADPGFPTEGDVNPPERGAGVISVKFSKNCIKIQNKKVLLRERKRHNARRVASARFANGEDGVGGTPFSLEWGGVPHPVLDGVGGYPPSRPGMGYPPINRIG